MASDQFGNYVVGLESEGAHYGQGVRLLGVHGVPPNSLGNDGDLAVDIDTGTVYSKSGGAWAVLSGGGGANVDDFFRAGNYAGGTPNWTPTGTVGLAYDTSNGEIWNYYSGQWR